MTNEINTAIDDEYFNNYLKNNNELADANMLVSKINEVSKNTGVEAEIKELENKIDSCKAL